MTRNVYPAHAQYGPQREVEVQEENALHAQARAPSYNIPHVQHQYQPSVLYAPDVPLMLEPMLEKFQKLHPPSFDGNTDPVVLKSR